MMTDPKALVDLGKLSKPATTLIEKVSEAVGGVFKPYQIVRVAKAEAQAEAIRAEAQIQVTDLQRRAVHRWFEEEAKKQENIEEITRKALPHLDAESKPEAIENDWIANFFDRSRLISDDEMQQLWARVLAGEANKHGSYSKRTINMLASLDKRDAERFTALCTFCWMFGGVTALVFKVDDPIYERHGVTFGSLMHFEDIGLVQFEHLAGFIREKLPKVITPHYYGTPLQLTMPAESDNTIDIGHVLLTQVGQELAPISGSKPDPEFFKYVQEHWTYLQPDLTPPAPSAHPA